MNHDYGNGIYKAHQGLGGETGKSSGDGMSNRMNNYAMAREIRGCRAGPSMGMKANVLERAPRQSYLES